MSNTDHDLARLAARVGRRLRDSQRAVATAESCTGGWIAKALTDIAGSSQWFLEGFVTYSNESKTLRLGVPRSILRSDGAVSEAAVRAMAAGALERSGAQLAVAVTGIAGPGGEVPGKPVGTVWLGWAERRGLQAAAILRAPLRAHVALARKVAQLPVLQAMSPFSWPARSFSLIGSDTSGVCSVYTVVDTWPLLDETPTS
jgi:nicotinamide-nucleotide amidase